MPKKKRREAPIIEAVNNRNEAEVRRLIAKGVDLTVTDVVRGLA